MKIMADRLTHPHLRIFDVPAAESPDHSSNSTATSPASFRNRDHYRLRMPLIGGGLAHPSQEGRSQLPLRHDRNGQSRARSPRY